MTLITASPEPTTVDIVALMTGIAIRTKDLCQWQFVAGSATHFAMRSVKQELGVAVVIETPDRPATGDMARLAFVTKCLFVYIFLLMATDARAGRLAIARGLVAILTLGNTMPAGQRKLRLVVVESRVLPRRVTVTTRTILAQFTLVNVIFGVA